MHLFEKQIMFSSNGIELSICRIWQLS